MAVPDLEREPVVTIGPGRTHGLRATYGDGCRCDDCRRAERDYQRRGRAVRAYKASGTRFHPEPRPAAWADRRACAGLGWSLFFPEHGEPSGTAEVRAVCESCPVARECLDDALYYEQGGGERFGFVGGMTPRERAAEHARRAAMFHEEPSNAQVAPAMVGA